MIKIKDFKHNNWVKIYDGKWSFLTSSHFGGLYTKELIFGKRPFKSQSIILSSHGHSSGWMRQTDRDILGDYLGGQIKRSPSQARKISSSLKSQTKSFLAFIEKHENTVTTQKLYDEFWKRLFSYYHAHIYVKYVVDYLHPDLLKKYLPALQDARLTAEPVLNRTEDFMISFAKLLNKKTKYHYTLLLCLTKDELKDYFKGKQLPKKNELIKRNKRSALFHDNKSFIFFTGKHVDAVEKFLSHVSDVSSVKGSSAFAGKAKGTVRIVSDPRKVKTFKQGDILVTGATRPEFLPLMFKAAAFVTDAGGILSHAAITARELKKPCVIGTNNATKIFKDGDMVEVDADKGVVKKI